MAQWNVAYAIDNDPVTQKSRGYMTLFSDITATMASSSSSRCYDCVLCQRGTLPRSRRCLSKLGSNHLLAVLRSLGANFAVDDNSWLCRPCSRSLEQLKSAREHVGTLEVNIRRRLEAGGYGYQASAVGATDSTASSSQSTRLALTPQRPADPSSPLDEQRSAVGRTAREPGTVTRRYDTPTRSALQRMIPSATSPAVAVSLHACIL